jgi:hypothetical protein
MKFWKFETPPRADFERCTQEGRLPPEVQFPGLRSTHAYPAENLKVGDGLVIARLDGEEAKIVALGKVRSIDPGSHVPSVQWAVTSHTKFPDARGGLANWQTKTAFEITKEPAERYGLLQLVNYYVKDPA